MSIVLSRIPLMGGTFQQLTYHSPPTLSQHPVSWQPSPDGTRLLGHMILQKNFKDANFPLLSGTASATSSSSSATILGLKVIGGKLLPGGRIGAVVEKVKKGSIADNVGRLLPGMHKYAAKCRLVRGMNTSGRPGRAALIVHGLDRHAARNVSTCLCVCRGRGPRMERPVSGTQELRRGARRHRRVEVRLAGGASRVQNALGPGKRGGGGGGGRCRNGWPRPSHTWRASSIAAIGGADRNTHSGRKGIFRPDTRPFKHNIDFKGQPASEKSFFYFKGQRPVLFCVFLRKNLTALKLFGMI